MFGKGLTTAGMDANCAIEISSFDSVSAWLNTYFWSYVMGSYDVLLLAPWLSLILPDLSL